jgi:hypothetical protein
MQGSGVHAQPLAAARRPACGRAPAAPQCSAASTPAHAAAHAAATAALPPRRERGSRVVAHASSGGEEESAVFGFLKKVQGGLPVIGLVRRTRMFTQPARAAFCAAADMGTPAPRRSRRRLARRGRAATPALHAGTR